MDSFSSFLTRLAKDNSHQDHALIGRVALGLAKRNEPRRFPGLTKRAARRLAREWYREELLDERAREMEAERLAKWNKMRG